MNSKEFALKIEEIVKEKKLTHMEAVVWYCEKNEIDLTTVKPIINKVLKERLKRMLKNSITFRRVELYQYDKWF